MALESFGGQESSAGELWVAASSCNGYLKTCFFVSNSTPKRKAQALHKKLGLIYREADRHSKALYES